MEGHVDVRCCSWGSHSAMGVMDAWMGQAAPELLGLTQELDLFGSKVQQQLSHLGGFQKETSATISSVESTLAGLGGQVMALTRRVEEQDGLLKGAMEREASLVEQLQVAQGDILGLQGAL